jgi:hypothetical protein
MSYAILLAADLAVGVISSSQKVRPADNPTLQQTAQIKAAKNEFEAFQIVLRASGSDVAQVSAKVATPFSIAAPITLYAEQYYDVGVASNDDGAPGLWPDALVPDVQVPPDATPGD